MIDDASMTALIRRRMPDAEVHIVDLTGTMDHFNVVVRSNAFAGVPLMDRHRMVEGALAEARADGRIHALSIRTETLEQTR
jgi:stress-induced morphogen